MSDGYLQDVYFTVGGTQNPLTSLLTNTLLQDADPSLFYILKYYTGVLQLDIEPRWNACISGAGLADLDGYLPNQVLPYDPFRTKISPQNSWRFPLLAVYPVSTDYEFLTTTWFHLKRKFELLFSLPPLNSEQYEYLYPFLQLVEKVIVDRTLNSYDSNFNSGELVWKEAGLEKISIVGNSKYGSIPLDTNIYLPTLLMNIVVVERRMPDYRGTSAITGFDNTITTNTVDVDDGYIEVVQKINL